MAEAALDGGKAHGQRVALKLKFLVRNWNSRFSLSSLPTHRNQPHISPLHRLPVHPDAIRVDWALWGPSGRHQRRVGEEDDGQAAVAGAILHLVAPVDLPVAHQADLPRRVDPSNLFQQLKVRLPSVVDVHRLALDVGRRGEGVVGGHRPGVHLIGGDGRLEVPAYEQRLLTGQVHQVDLVGALAVGVGEQRPVGH